MRESQDSLNELLKDIQVAEQQLENGEGIPHEEVRRRLLQKVSSRSGSQRKIEEFFSLTEAQSSQSMV
jgi:hypothetical protein